MQNNVTFNEGLNGKKMNKFILELFFSDVVYFSDTMVELNFP